MKLYKGKYTADQLREYIKLQGGIRAAARHLGDGVTESGIREFLKANVSDKEDKRPIAAGTLHAPDVARTKLEGKRFVFTSAQNNTYIHEDFFAALLRFCEHKEAQLVVSQFSYNKSGFQNATKDNEELWYDKRLAPFVLNESREVAAGLVYGGELDILPTASNPLSGFEGYFQQNSGIIPHAKVALQSLPRMKHEDARFLYTTGAVTLRNYIQRKAGQKAEFHHVFGALYVEVDDDGRWFARQLIADNTGEFYDLTTKYTPLGYVLNQNVLAINYGDIHIEKMDFDVAYGTWGGPNSMAPVLQPQFQFIHDLTDFSARNHHNIKDPYFLADMHFNKGANVEENIRLSAQFLNDIERFANLTVVVESNHDQAFQRWLREADIRQDPENAEYYHAMNAKVFCAIKSKHSNFSIYETALRAKYPLIDTVFLREDDTFVIANNSEAEENGKIIGGIECGLHGHRGPNGARGSVRNLRTIGRKVNLGHSHSAAIVDGAYVAGVSGKLDMDYNKGPSSWSHSHIVTYQNGKRAIVTIRDGKWRA